MGWSSGEILGEQIWIKAKPYLSHSARRDVAAIICECVADGDGELNAYQDRADQLGDAANAIKHAQEGAPENPKEGDEYTDSWGVRFRFDGKRWQE